MVAEHHVCDKIPDFLQYPPTMASLNAPWLPVCEPLPLPQPGHQFHWPLRKKLKRLRNVVAQWVNQMVFVEVVVVAVGKSMTGVDLAVV